MCSLPPPPPFLDPVLPFPDPGWAAGGRASHGVREQPVLRALHHCPGASDQPVGEQPSSGQEHAVRLRGSKTPAGSSAVSAIVEETVAPK